MKLAIVVMFECFENQKLNKIELQCTLRRVAFKLLS